MAKEQSILFYGRLNVVGEQSGGLIPLLFKLMVVLAVFTEVAMPQCF